MPNRSGGKILVGLTTQSAPKTGCSNKPGTFLETSGFVDSGYSFHLKTGTLRWRKDL
jgi:hypothetical protein